MLCRAIPPLYRTTYRWISLATHRSTGLWGKKLPPEEQEKLKLELANEAEVEGSLKPKPEATEEDDVSQSLDLLVMHLYSVFVCCVYNLCCRYNVAAAACVQVPLWYDLTTVVCAFVVHVVYYW